MIIDTHCHYNLVPLFEDVDLHLEKAKSCGIEKSIVVGTNFETSQKAIALSKKYSSLYASIGIHPGVFTTEIKQLLDGDKYSQDEIDQILDQKIGKINSFISDEINSNNKKLVAIGEIGLDYYRLKKKGLKRNLVVEMQKKAFASQLSTAFQNNLVAIIHVRDQDDRTENNAYLDTIEIIKAELTKYKTEKKFVLHCISGPDQYIKEAIYLGAYIGVAGNVTYTNAQNISEIVSQFPLDRILIETDAPYLPPLPHTQEICEPYMIQDTANFLHKELGLNLDIIRQNTNSLFFNK